MNRKNFTANNADIIVRADSRKYIFEGNVLFWEKNKKILQKHYLKFLDELSSKDNEDFPHEVKIDAAPTGDLTMSINGLSVHSPRDPAREGERLAGAAEAGTGPVIILGFGLGYAAQSAAKHAASSSRPVIIAEKHRKLLRLAFESRDFTEFLSSQNIIFVVGGTGDGIVNALSAANELNKKNNGISVCQDRPIPAIIRNRALVDLDNEWYKNVENKIRTYSMKDKVNTATLKRFGKRWVRNIARNMSAIRDLPGVERLTANTVTRTDKNFPVFLAAAGPSLDNVKPFLRDIYDRCIVVAVDTNLRFFTENGIQPDFVLTVDPQFWNSRHLDRCADSEAVRAKTALIVESAVFPPILHLPFKRKFICGSLFPLSLFIEKQVDPKGRLGAGGSVATTAWDFARLLSDNRGQSADIWIAGLDLAFPKNKTHFRGARFEEKANAESNRFNPVETWAVRALRDGIPFTAKASSGGQVLTDSRLSLYAAWFENQFNQHRNIRNLSLLQEGLALNGMGHASPEQFLALPVRRNEIDSHLESCYAQIETEFNNAEETRKRSARYYAAVESLVSGLNGIKKAAEDGIKIIMSYAPESGQSNITDKLDNILKKIAESEFKEIASFLFPIEEDKEEKNNGGDPFRAYLESTLKLFSSLSESAGFYLECFSKDNL